MKQRNTWKMKLSVLLMVVMMLNMTITAFARWEMDDEGWKYTKEDGTPVKDEVRKIHDNWYSFDENGYMETGWIKKLGNGHEFYAVPNGELASKQWLKIGDDWYHFSEIKEVDGEIRGGGIAEPNELKLIQDKYYYFDEESKMVSNRLVTYENRTFYAQEDGSLADRGWLYLKVDEEGNVVPCDHAVNTDCEDCAWYYFRDIYDEEEQEYKGMITSDGIKTLGPEKKDYAFKDGKMVSRDWFTDEETGNSYYFQSTGEKVTGKWLPIDGYWYEFDETGKVKSYAEIPEKDGKLWEGITDAATEVRAPYPIIDSIVADEDNVDVIVGKEAVLKFEINLATKSNASRDLESNHDIWISASNMGNVKSSVKDNTIELTYTAGMKETTETVCVWADDIVSNVVTVNTKLTKLANSSEDINTGAEVKDAFSNILDKAAEDPTGAVESLKQAYDSENETVKEAVHNQLLDSDKQNQLEKLEEKYAEANNITIMEHEVSAENVGEVTVTGGALNAEPGDFVQLKVGDPEDDDYAIDGNFDIRAAFDIVLSIMGADGQSKGSSVLSIPVVITMKLPEGFTKDDKLFNLHDGEQIEVTFKIVGSNIQFVTDRFSTYVFAITDKSATTTTPGSSSGSGGKNDVYSELNTGYTSNSRAGSWIKDANGWWIRLNDGTYPINTWMYLDFNGDYQWYHFDSMGYMRTGWFTDTDGRRYYLNPISDGTQGAMATGWKLIDSFWYYFNTVSDGTKGALLVNTTTPDGYAVNENGQRIQ